jgi:type IV pilus assembly protein PilQ
MKLHHILPLLALLPLALGAAADDAAGSDVAAGDVVVEVPDRPVPGVSAGEEIPVVTAPLPADAEVVLELPGRQTGGSASMTEEETISVDFPDEDVRTILRNVAELFDLNLVIPDTLQGRTSLKLRNVTWRQVFEVVLEPLGYTYVEDRNIISVKSIEELTTEPVDTRVFVANYAKASELQGSIAPLIDGAAGGQIRVDTRSNALVITERPSRMNKVQEIIERLDQPNQQVMIESKFIEVTKGDSQRIGVNWAYLDPEADDLLGGRLGAGWSGESISEDGFSYPFFNIDDPSWTSGNLLAVFSRGEFAAAIEALESSRNAKLVSNPTVVVMNNQKALFQVGEDFPIREITVNTDTGLTQPGDVEYRFVGIELNVTPSVNAAGMITLDIEPEVSKRDDNNVVENNYAGATVRDQIFETRNAKTQVTIKDGYTIAIGGLTEESVTDRRDQVPLLGDLPIFGKLFQSNSDISETVNLLVFLTARTLNPDGASYEEIVDPRMIDEMELTDEDLPGYEMSAAEKARMEKLRGMREDAAERKNAFQFEVEKQKLKDDKGRDELHDKARETFKGVPRYQLRRSR